MKILFASDHAGIELKNELVKRFAPAEDLGPSTPESVDYPDYATRLCQRLLEIDPTAGGPGATKVLGVLICGSGVGMSIAANRIHGIRAVLSESVEIAKLGREHNHGNVLCLGARRLSADQASEILKTFIQTAPDSGERHQRRVDKLK